jgi:hypothetical protein
MMENKFQVAINAGGAGSGPRPPPPTRAAAAAAVDWHLPCAAQDKKRTTRSHQAKQAAANLRNFNLSALNSFNLLN